MASMYPHQGYNPSWVYQQQQEGSPPSLQNHHAGTYPVQPQIHSLYAERRSTVPASQADQPYQSAYLGQQQQQTHHAGTYPGQPQIHNLYAERRSTVPASQADQPYQSAYPCQQQQQQPHQAYASQGYQHNSQASTYYQQQQQQPYQSSYGQPQHQHQQRQQQQHQSHHSPTYGSSYSLAGNNYYYDNYNNTATYNQGNSRSSRPSNNNQYYNQQQQVVYPNNYGYYNQHPQQSQKIMDTLKSMVSKIGVTDIALAYLICEQFKAYRDKKRLSWFKQWLTLALSDRVYKRHQKLNQKDKKKWRKMVKKQHKQSQKHQRKWAAAAAAHKGSGVRYRDLNEHRNIINDRDLKRFQSISNEQDDEYDEATIFDDALLFISSYVSKDHENSKSSSPFVNNNNCSGNGRRRVSSMGGGEMNNENQIFNRNINDLTTNSNNNNNTQLLNVGGIRESVQKDPEMQIYEQAATSIVYQTLKDYKHNHSHNYNSGLLGISVGDLLEILRSQWVRFCTNPLKYPMVTTTVKQDSSTGELKVTTRQVNYSDLLRQSGINESHGTSDNAFESVFLIAIGILLFVVLGVVPPPTTTSPSAVTTSSAFDGKTKVNWKSNEGRAKIAYQGSSFPLPTFVGPNNAEWVSSNGNIRFKTCTDNNGLSSSPQPPPPSLSQYSRPPSYTFI